MDAFNNNDAMIYESNIKWFVRENVGITNIFKAFWAAIANLGRNPQNRHKCLSVYLHSILGKLFWTFRKRHNWSFCIDSATNILHNILHFTATSSSLQHCVHRLISALMPEPFSDSRKQDAGCDSIMQSLCLPNILCLIMQFA